MKRFLTRGHWGLLALLTLGAAAPCTWADASYSTVILGDGPTAYWRLGESSSTSIAADASGNGWTGVYSRGVSGGLTGAINGDSDTASLFDGVSGFIEVRGGGGSQNAFNLANGFTIEAWVMYNGPSESTVASRIFSTRWFPTGTTNAGYGFGVLANSGVLRFTTFGVLDYDGSAANGSVVPQDGAWHQVAVVFDSTNAANFYVDGQLTETVFGSNPARNSTSPVHIGRNPVPDGAPPGGAFEYWNGGIDEVAFYTAELQPSQILAHFMAAH